MSYKKACDFSNRKESVREIPVLGGGQWSRYKGIIVVWDEDYDDRVIDLIDSLPIPTQDNLLVISESRGNIKNGVVPKGRRVQGRSGD